MIRNVPDAIIFLDSMREDAIKQGKSCLIVETQIVDTEYDVVSYITSYYNNKQIACTMKYCVKRNSYEVNIWW